MRATKIAGAVCVVSGASQGIGCHIAQQLADLGAKKVVLVARTKSKLDEIVALINAKHPGVAECFAVDCSKYEQVEEMANIVIQRHGAPTILVNSAGAGAWRYLWEMSASDIEGCLNGLLDGLYHAISDVSSSSFSCCSVPGKGFHCSCFSRLHPSPPSRP